MAMQTTQNDNSYRLAQGEQILQSLPEDVRELLGEGSGKVKFINLLGNPFKTQGIVTKGGDIMPGFEKQPTTIGALFEAMAEVKVPVVTASKKLTDSLTKDDITWRTVAAGEKFALTLIEAYVLAIQPEYSMFFGALNANGEFDDKGCKVTPRWATSTSSTKAAAKLPTPTFSEASGRILRKDVIAVCSGSKEAPVWADPMYEKFSALICRAPKSTTGGGTPVDSRAAKIEEAKKTALYCRQLLESSMGASAQ